MGVSSFPAPTADVGAWPAWAPDLYQPGLLTKTLNYAKVVRDGRTIKWSIRCTFTSAGTAGNALLLNLPVPAAFAQVQCGTALFFDASVGTQWNGMNAVVSVGVASMFFHRADAQATAAFGADPSLAVASGDVLVASGEYEAAS